MCYSEKGCPELFKLHPGTQASHDDLEKEKNSLEGWVLPKSEARKHKRKGEGGFSFIKYGPSITVL